MHVALAWMRARGSSSPKRAAHPVPRPRSRPPYAGLCVAGNGGRILLLAHLSVPSKHPQAAVPVELKSMLSPLSCFVPATDVNIKFGFLCWRRPQWSK